jgi:hypothetical protein
MRKLLQSLPLFFSLAVPQAVSQELPAECPPTGLDAAGVQQGDSLSSFLARNTVTHNSIYVLTPAEQSVLQRLKANECRKKETERRAFEADKKRWGECYGIHQYDWQNWKKAANGTWVTEKRLCVLPSSLRIRPSLLSTWPRQTRSTDQWKDSIAVTCEGLKISDLNGIFKNGWSEWTDPDSGQSEMLVKLCSREEL